MAKSVSQVEGVLSVDLNFATSTLTLDYDPGTPARDRVLSVLRGSGLGVQPMPAPCGEAGADETGGLPQPTWWQKHGHTASVLASGVLIACGYVLRLAGFGQQVVSPASLAFLAAILVGGSVTARRAVASLRSRSLDMNVLMSLAVIGAAALGDFAEAATVIFLFSVGQLLEARALDRTRRSIRDLVGLTPLLARLRRDGREVEVPPTEAKPGETLLVRPGERIALDGVVAKGSSAVDESAITGESIPAEKVPGAPVYAGSLNASGLLEVKVTAVAADSTLSRVIYMVEEAQAQRAPVQRLVDRFTRYYTPAVVAVAAVIAVVPPALASVLNAPWGGWEAWFYRALVMLVVACPCALVISTPVAIVSAITRATRDGVLVKGGAFLETAPKVRAVAIDKTGTLTVGRPEVTDVVSLDHVERSEILALAASLEAGSAHPLAEAVVRAHGGERRVEHLEEYADLAGRGVRAKIGGVGLTIGSTALAVESEPLTQAATDEIERLEDEGKSVLVLSREGSAIGLIAVADSVRPEARAIVAALRRTGIRHIVMLTGDNPRTAAAVAAQAGLSEYRARLLPEDKVLAVREARKEYGAVAMVGDGVNDAPALVAADVGIAMGAAGSDTALETADVALMRPDLTALPGFFDLGRRTVGNITFNVVFSIVTKLVVLALAISGFAALWLAVFADVGVSLLVTLNGLRLLRRRSTRT